jgi:outer membrane protein assembly factor BamD (BamD/ComL family)
MPMKRAVSGLLLIIAAANWLVFSTVTASAERRVALVIGNSSYQNVARLPNPTKDAEAIAQMFRKAGFEAVQLRTDLGYLDFRRTLRRFEDASAGADIAVVFYAGHGIELDGTNYMIPIDAKLAVDRDAKDEAIELGRLTEAVQSSKRLSLVILDACRDNPFLNAMQRQHQAVRSTTRGRGLIDPTGEMRRDMLIAYAAKEGSTANDGKGEHSPFTMAILHNLTEPGLDIRLAFGRIRDEVLKATNNQQEPYVYTSIGADSISLVPAPAQPKPTSEDETGRDYNAVMKAFEAVHTRVPLDVFLKKYPVGFYSELVREQLKKFESDLKLAGRESESRPRFPPLSADAQAWDALQNSNDKEAILKFMRLYRNSPKYSEAQRRLQLLLEREMNDAWEAATAANTAAVLQDFVRRYPDSPFVSEAKRRADRVIKATQENAQAEAAEARRRAVEAAAAKAWKAVQNSNNPVELQSFINAFPDSSLASNEATKRLSMLDQQARERVDRAQTEAAKARLAWDEIKDSTDQVVLQEFIARYANTPIAHSDAKNRLQELQRLQREEADASMAWSKNQGSDNPAQLQDSAKGDPASIDASMAQEQACSRDEDTLVHLRATLVRDEVVRFAREFGCERLRSQILRLLESVAPEWERADHEATQRPPDRELRPTANAEPQKADIDTSGQLTASVTQEQICKHDQETLARLRASQLPDEVIRFEHELGCERLRPQVVRLRESLGVH